MNDGRGVRDERAEQDWRADEQRGVDEGLTVGQAAARRQHYGPNAVAKERRSVVVELLSHFWGPIPWMIEAALILTAVTGRWTDFGIILALLLLNGGVGFWEEHQAQSAIAALQQRLAKKAEVKRDGKWISVATAEVVPGDLVRVARGTIVPADGRVVDVDCEVDESALTGESLPVSKAAGDDIFSGSAMSRGEPAVRVMATGTGTQFGRTEQLAGRQAPESHFQRVVINIGKYLIGLAVVLVVVIVLVSLLRGSGVASTLEFALVVLIASVPVALPAVLSVTMAVGARYLAKREAVVSHLPAIEEMAGVDVLCIDKTGTVTKNVLAVADVAVIGHGADSGQVLRDAALSSQRDSRDAIDQAVFAAVDTDRLSGISVVDFTPFDSARKFSQARVRGEDGQEFSTAKGAVQAIGKLVASDGQIGDRVSAATRDFAGKGYRALAVACRHGDQWQVTGVLALRDPPREDSRETLQRAARLGVEIKMVTGDRVEIGREIAGEVGLGCDVVEAGQIEHVQGEDLVRRVEQADGFAQVVPETKYRIVETLQTRRHIVGMTGDGVNDAPALKRADAGIAVSGATDAARAASDIVLLAPGLSTIVEAIHRSREVFGRMKNYAIYRITETIRVVVFVTLTILVFAFFPVTPIQVVLLAILNDAAILSIAYDRVRPASRPASWHLSEVLPVATSLGLVGVVSTFGLVWLAHLPLHITDAHMRTLIYLKLSVSGHLTVFLARTRGPFWSHRPAWILLGAVTGTQVVATAIARSGLLMQPIGWDLVGLAWGWAFAEFLILDPIKLATYRVLERRGRAVRAVAPSEPAE